MASVHDIEVCIITCTIIVWLATKTRSRSFSNRCSRLDFLLGWRQLKEGLETSTYISAKALGKVVHENKPSFAHAFVIINHHICVVIYFQTVCVCMFVGALVCVCLWAHLFAYV